MTKRKKATSSTTTIEMVKPSGVVTLTKEQFGNSNLPGSEYVHASSKVHEPEYSLKRLAALGLIGAGVGAGVGHGTKKRRTGRGALIGGAAGVAGSLLYDFMKKNDEPEVVGAAVDPNGRGSLVLVGSRKLTDASKTKFLKALSHPLVATISPMLVAKGNVSDLPGWAGTVISHGMYVQGCMMQWMIQRTAASEGKRLHLQPHWAYIEPEDTTVTGNGIGSTAGKDFGGSFTWTNVWAEWPSPIFKDYRLDGNANYIGSSMANLIGKWRDDAISSAKDSGKASWEQGFWYTFGGYAMNPAHSSIPIDSFWRKPENAVEFHERYSKMMTRSQWLVWAGEMLRLHSVDPALESGVSFDPHSGQLKMSAPSGDVGPYESGDWRRHCNTWGVGYATANRMDDRWRMTQTAHDLGMRQGGVNAAKWKDDENGDHVDNVDLWPIRLPLNHAAVKKYLEKIMAVTPKLFGTPSSEMLTIVHPDDARMFMDFPDDKMGAMIPPPYNYFLNEDWYQSLADSFWSNDKRGKVYQLVTQVIGAVISAVATYFGGPAGTLIGAAVSICLSLIRMGFNGSFGSISPEDICSMIGEVVAVVGAQLKVGALEVTGDFTSFLKGIQETIEESGVIQTFLGVMDTMESIQQSYNWPYVNDMFPTVIDIEKALDYEAALGI